MYLGIDVGGSNTKIVVASGKNIKSFKILEKNIFKTPSNRQALTEFLAHQIILLETKYSTKFLNIGIASAGVLNADRTKILHSPNISELNGFALPRALHKKVPRNYILENDANLFVLAENLIGAAKGLDNVVGLTLGTGVGSGFFYNGEIITGVHGGAAEIGHSVILANGIKCTCGGRGHLEDYVSARFFNRKAHADVMELAQRARTGNRAAQIIFDEMSFYLGCALANIANYWDPGLIIIGGGIAEESDYFLKKAIAVAQTNVLSPASARSLTVKKSKLGIFAGAIGAALFSIKQ